MSGVEYEQAGELLVLLREIRDELTALRYTVACAATVTAPDRTFGFGAVHKAALGLSDIRRVFGPPEVEGPDV